MTQAGPIRPLELDEDPERALQAGRPSRHCCVPTASGWPVPRTGACRNPDGRPITRRPSARPECASPGTMLLLHRAQNGAEIVSEDAAVHHPVDLATSAVALDHPSPFGLPRAAAPWRPARSPVASSQLIALAILDVRGYVGVACRRPRVWMFVRRPGRRFLLCSTTAQPSGAHLLFRFSDPQPRVVASSATVVARPCAADPQPPTKRNAFNSMPAQLPRLLQLSRLRSALRVCCRLRALHPADLAT